jgi:hypothetical protein
MLPDFFSNEKFAVMAVGAERPSRRHKIIRIVLVHKRQCWIYITQMQQIEQPEGAARCLCSLRLAPSPQKVASASRSLVPCIHRPCRPI